VLPGRESGMGGPILCCGFFFKAREEWA
jgi:hypothetical protein